GAAAGAGAGGAGLPRQGRVQLPAQRRRLAVLLLFDQAGTDHPPCALRPGAAEGCGRDGGLPGRDHAQRRGHRDRHRTADRQRALEPAAARRMEPVAARRACRPRADGGMRMFRGYLRLLVLAFGLLVGVLVPGFIDDYAKRVAAQRAESEESLLGFRETAARFFNADLNALVAHYRASSDEVMRSDAESIAYLVTRAELLEAEWLAMQGPWYAQAWHLATAADREILQQTLDAYSYQVLLAPQAIAWA